MKDYHKFGVPLEITNEAAIKARPVKNQRKFRDYFTVVAQNRMALFGLTAISIVAITAILAPYLAPYDPYAFNLSNKLSGPSLTNWFGTDIFGRDVLSRIIYGARLTMLVSISAVIFGFIIGAPIGAIAGYLGGWIETLLMRFIDALLSFPGRLLAISLAATLGAGFISIFIAVGVGSIPNYARIVRGAVLTQKPREYVEAARVTGESKFRVLISEIIPNCMPPLMVQVSLDFAHAILIESSLSFLGLGFPPPTPSWGLMLNEAKGYIEIMPWAAIIPGSAISFLILGFNLFGDGLRDVFDPRHYKR